MTRGSSVRPFTPRTLHRPAGNMLATGETILRGRTQPPLAVGAPRDPPRPVGDASGVDKLGSATNMQSMAIDPNTRAPQEESGTFGKLFTHAHIRAHRAVTMIESSHDLHFTVVLPSPTRDPQFPATLPQSPIKSKVREKNRTHAHRRLRGTVCTHAHSNMRKTRVDLFTTTTTHSLTHPPTHSRTYLQRIPIRSSQPRASPNIKGTSTSTRTLSGRTPICTLWTF